MGALAVLCMLLLWRVRATLDLELVMPAGVLLSTGWSVPRLGDLKVSSALPCQNGHQVLAETSMHMSLQQQFCRHQFGTGMAASLATFQVSQGLQGSTEQNNGSFRLMYAAEIGDQRALSSRSPGATAKGPHPAYREAQDCSEKPEALH